MSACFSIEFLTRSFAIGCGAWLILRATPRGHRVREWVMLGALVLLGGSVAMELLPAAKIHLGILVSSAPTGRTGPGTERWVWTLWMTGVALFVLREVLAVRKLHGILKSSRPAEDAVFCASLEEARRITGYTKPVDLRVGGAFGPAALGCWRRLVLLPDVSMEWDTAKLCYVLTHELTHLRRCDPLKHALARWICAVHWFNPFAHLLRQAIETEREFACDREAIRAGNANGYGECLLSLASERVAPLQHAMTIRATGSQLEWRIRRLFAECPRLRTVEIAVVAVLMGLLAACVFLSPFEAKSSARWDRPEIERRLAADAFPGNR